MKTLLLRIFLLPSLFILFAACGPSEVYVKEQIEKARVCKKRKDCMSLGSHCPFGCSIAINKSQKEAIKNLLNSYSSQCQYDCLEIKSIECEKKKCITKFKK